MNKIGNSKILKNNVIALCVSGIIILVYLVRLWLVIPDGLSLKNYMPSINDEWSYYLQIESMIRYGKPLGYYGYYGSHAAIGTYGAWGWALLVPYAIIGKLIGWHSYSFIIANLILMFFSNYIFVLLTRISKEKCLLFVLASLFIYTTQMYTLSSFAACSRYACAIILLGMLYHLYKFETNRVFKYILLPAMLLYSMLNYIILAVFLPIYILILAKNRKLYVKIISVLGMTGIVTSIMYYLTTKFTATYATTGEFRTATFVQNLFVHPFSSIKEIIKNIMSCLSKVDLLGILSLINGDLSIAIGACTTLIVLLILCYNSKFIKKNKETLVLSRVALYFMIMVFVLHAILYTDSFNNYSVFLRGINIAVIVAVYLLCLDINSKKSAIIFIICMCFFAGDMYSAIDQRFEYCFYDDEWFQNVEDRKENICKVMDINPNNTTWENTVAMNGSNVDTAFVMPAGTGKNYYGDELANMPSEKEKYVFITKPQDMSNEDMLQLYENMLNNQLATNHSIIYEDDRCILLLNNVYAQSKELCFSER